MGWRDESEHVGGSTPCHRLCSDTRAPREPAVGTLWWGNTSSFFKHEKRSFHSVFPGPAFGMKVRGNDERLRSCDQLRDIISESGILRQVQKRKALTGRLDTLAE